MYNTCKQEYIIYILGMKCKLFFLIIKVRLDILYATRNVPVKIENSPRTMLILCLQNQNKKILSR
jgi:hypothetical protein